MLSDDFELTLSDDLLISRMVDQIMYNGIETEKFLKLREWMENSELHKEEFARIYDGFKNGIIPVTIDNIISDDNWKHKI